LEIDKSLI